MECDRCTVFVYDERKNELWSKVAKGTKGVIRLSATQGIAGKFKIVKFLFFIKFIQDLLQLLNNLSIS